MRVHRARYAFVEHEALVLSASRGAGDPTNADAREAEQAHENGHEASAIVAISKQGGKGKGGEVVELPSSYTTLLTGLRSQPSYARPR